MKQGFLFVISGPSAVGKTSVASEILKREKKLSRIITCTTRSIRKGEINGADYYFISVNEFLQHKNNGDFAEYAEVYGNYYGVLLSTIKEKIDNGLNSLLVVNWKGYLKIKHTFKKQVIGFFLVPPSINDLETRIRGRGTDSEEVIAHRMEMITEDMQHKDEFEFCIENVKIDETASNILEIINEYE